MRISDWSSDVCSSDLDLVSADRLSHRVEVAHRVGGGVEVQVRALRQFVAAALYGRAHRVEHRGLVGWHVRVGEAFALQRIGLAGAALVHQHTPRWLRTSLNADATAG